MTDLADALRPIVRAANVADIRDSLLLDLLKRWPERGRRKMFDAVAAATARMLEAHLSALAAASPEPERCASCNGTLWVDDENWEPGHPRAKRKPHDGLIPCGACNEGGWDAPWPSPAAPTVEACVFNMRAEGVPLPDCGLPPGHQNHQPPKQHFGQHPFRSSATVEALRDARAALVRIIPDVESAFWEVFEERLETFEAAARADERTRREEPVIWCLCGDGLRTLRDMAEHLSAIHDVDICGEAHP